MLTVVEAIESEINELADRDPALAASGYAAGAMALAQGLDSNASLAMKAVAMKELRDTMNRLRELAPPEKARDRVDELRERRDAGRRAAAKGRSRARAPKVNGA